MFNATNALINAKRRNATKEIAQIKLYIDFINQFPQFVNDDFGFFMIAHYGTNLTCYIDENYRAESVNDMGYYRHATNNTYGDAKRDFKQFDHPWNITSHEMLLQFCTESKACEFIICSADEDDTFHIAKEFGALCGYYC